MGMRETISEELLAVERERSVHVLLAVESGSRAWGMASADSDYDVRFVYVRREEDYLRLEDVRDTVEWGLDETYDVVGWDICKFLRLMRGSNPTVFEWLESPIIYREAPAFGEVREKALKCFSSKASAYHYLGMAKGEEKIYSKADKVSAKTYLYAMRAVLAARWVLDKGTPGPMEFRELIDTALGADMASMVDKLLKAKSGGTEKCEVPHMPDLEEWIAEEMASLFDRARVTEAPEKMEWAELDELFLRLVRE